MALRIGIAAWAAWWIGLAALFAPLDAWRALDRHGPDSRLETSAPSGYDFYRSNAEVAHEATLRQRRTVAVGFVDRAHAQLEWFAFLAFLGPLVGAVCGGAVALWPQPGPARRRGGRASRA